MYLVFESDPQTLSTILLVDITLMSSMKCSWMFADMIEAGGCSQPQNSLRPTPGRLLAVIFIMHWCWIWRQAMFQGVFWRAGKMNGQSRCGFQKPMQSKSSTAVHGCSGAWLYLDYARHLAGQSLMASSAGRSMGRFSPVNEVWRCKPASKHCCAPKARAYLYPSGLIGAI